MKFYTAMIMLFSLTSAFARPCKIDVSNLDFINEDTNQRASIRWEKTLQNLGHEANFSFNEEGDFFLRLDQVNGKRNILGASVIKSEFYITLHDSKRKEVNRVSYGHCSMGVMTRLILGKEEAERYDCVPFLTANGVESMVNKKIKILTKELKCD